MKLKFYCLILLLIPQFAVASIVSTNYETAFYSEIAFGNFQYDSTQSPDYRDSLNQAIYQPTSSFFSLSYPDLNYSYTGSIEYVIVGNDIINPSGSPLPYDSFEIWVSMQGAQTSISLIDFSGMVFKTDSLPETLSLQDFDFSRFAMDFTITRSQPLTFLQTVPIPAPFFLFITTFGVLAMCKRSTKRNR